MRPEVRGSRVGAALLVALAASGAPRRARASSNYPQALKAALDARPGTPNKNHCVPLCTACHLTTQGGPGMPNVFGKVLENKGGLLPGNPALVGLAIEYLYMNDPTDDADGDGVSDFDEIEKGDSPSIAFPGGVSQFCSDIEYGCGAHVASAPPVDRLSLFSAGLVVLGFAAARRRRAKQRAGQIRI